MSRGLTPFWEGIIHTGISRIEKLCVMSRVVFLNLMLRSAAVIT